MMTFKQRIESIIGSMSKAEFAKKIDIHVSTIALWDDDHLPKGDILQRIHEEFSVNLNWLLTGKGEAYLQGREYDLRQEKTASVVRSSDYWDDYGVNPFSKAKDLLHRILSSGDLLITQALMSTLMAFDYAIQKAKQQSDEIKELNRECEELKERLSVLEEKVKGIESL